MADPLGGFLVEYWYIFLPIAIIYTIWFRNATKKRFNEEQILLENNLLRGETLIVKSAKDKIKISFKSDNVFKR